DLQNQVTPGLAGQDTDVTARYLMLNYQMNEDSSLTLRYDNWENEIDTVVASGTEGDAFTFTFAWNKKINDTSMFQFEYVSPDEQTIGAAASSDVDDDLIQFRYKVWF
ncbi:MAG: hypothetical protein KDD47_09125, partial [Acidobacteria bacterium]|nr:hypothetical protein [Acidobacteriota bacterium]